MVGRGLSCFVHNPEVLVLLVEMATVAAPTLQTDTMTAYILEYITFIVELTDLNKIQVLVLLPCRSSCAAATAPEGFDES